MNTQLIGYAPLEKRNQFCSLILSKEAVGGKTVAAVYDIFMTDEAGKPVSYPQTVIADKTDSDALNRTFRLRFTLKNADFKKTESYFLNVLEKDTTNIAAKEEFGIDIAYINDFDL